MKTIEEIKLSAEFYYGTDIGTIRGSSPYDLEGDRKNGFLAGYLQCQNITSSELQSKDKEIAELKEMVKDQSRALGVAGTLNEEKISEISALKEEVERLKKPEEVKEEDCDHEFIGQVGYPVVTCIKCGRKDTF